MLRMMKAESVPASCHLPSFPHFVKFHTHSVNFGKTNKTHIMYNTQMYSNHRTTSHYWKSFEPFLIKMTLIMYLFITTFYNHYKHCSGLKDSRSSALYVLFSKQQWVNMTITIWRYDNEATWQYSWSLSDVLYDPLWSYLWSRHKRKMLSWSRHFLLKGGIHRHFLLFFDRSRWTK